jgi:hypothetical protein
MSPEIIDGIEFFAYKIVCLLVGLAFCYMGYRLFLAGIRKGETDLEFSWKKIAIKVGKAAPGTCYALFGAFIVGSVVWKGYSSMERTTMPAYRAAEAGSKVELPEKLPRN